MMNDEEVKSLLEKIVVKSCKETGSSVSKFPLKVMGKIKRFKSMKSGYYVQIQNFTNLTLVKNSGDNKYFRYYFRCIQFENRGIPLLEICKWTPSHGSVEDGKVIYRDDDKRYKGSFIERMITVMNLVNLKL
jgi:hypothetical protein